MVEDQQVVVMASLWGDKVRPCVGLWVPTVAMVPRFMSMLCYFVG